MVAPRKGAMKKLLRRLKMSPEQRTRDIAAAPDRIVMRDHIFPEVARRGGDILFVGVRAYTAEYPDQFEEFGGTCWTIDRDRAAIAYGVAGRHVTGCVTRVDSLFSTCRFRTIVLTGVLGFGVNRFSDQIKTIAACAAILEPEGTLVLGWNDRRVHSSLFEEAASRWFDFRNFGTLPPRIWVRGYDHNFAFLRRRASDA
ncbi:MAG: methyltransferase [Pseudomonadota bacterium]